MTAPYEPPGWCLTDDGQAVYPCDPATGYPLDAVPVDEWCLDHEHTTLCTAPATSGPPPALPVTGVDSMGLGLGLLVATLGALIVRASRT